MFPERKAGTCSWFEAAHQKTLPIVALWHAPSAPRLCYHQCVSLRPLPIQHLPQPSSTAILALGGIAGVHSCFVKCRRASCSTPSCLVQTPGGADSRGRVHPMPVCATFESIILPCYERACALPVLDPHFPCTTAPTTQTRH